MKHISTKPDPFCGWYEWQESHGQLGQPKNDPWLGLYIARKFDARFTKTPVFTIDGISREVRTTKFVSLDTLESSFHKYTGHIVLYMTCQTTSTYAFSEVNQETFEMVPLDIPVKQESEFIIKFYILP